MIFMGEEWAAHTPWQFFTDFTDPALAEAVRDGRRAEFVEHGWNAEQIPDPQDVATRNASVLDWTEPGHGRHAELLEWYRELICLRRGEPDLLDDDLSHVRLTRGEGWVVVHRGAFEVLVNLGGREVDLPVRGPGTTLLAFGAQGPLDPVGVRADAGLLRLGPDAVAVLRLT
jgi:maltooligosyltrehalose trehalohydrolase